MIIGSKNKGGEYMKFDLLAIGNAIVDVIAFVDDNFVGAEKGSMRLIDSDEAVALYSKLPPSTEQSGGSAANTAAGFAHMGGKAAFIGKVKNDQLGEIFRHDLRSTGVVFDTPAYEEGLPTARCLILVTPDAERTMNTYLGSAAKLTKSDIDEAMIANSAIIYVEGYLWDDEDTKNALRYAISLAKKHQKKVAFTLSDKFCVDRHKNDFLELIKDINILFANEAEFSELFDIDLANNPDSPLEVQNIYHKSSCEIMVITRSEKGAIAISDSKIFESPAHDVKNLVDTTGAGDLFASGFLYEFSQNSDIKKCLEMGNIAAAKIIQQIGARLIYEG